MRAWPSSPWTSVRERLDLALSVAMAAVFQSVSFVKHAIVTATYQNKVVRINA